MPDAIAVPSLQTTADVVEQRLYDLERRRKLADQQQPEEDCCVTYCKILTANAASINSFSINNTLLSLSVPILNPGRLRIAVDLSFSINAAGDFWVQINPEVNATNYQVLSEDRRQTAGNGDRMNLDIDQAFDYPTGSTGFIAVAVKIFNLSNQQITVLSGSLTVDVKGRHGSVHCDPATIGQ